MKRFFCILALCVLAVLLALSQSVIISGGAKLSGGASVGDSSSSPITISQANIPAHGTNNALYSDQNVFDLGVSSTYTDSTPGDWKRFVATANDPASDNNSDIILRKQSATSRISNITYTGAGVTGPTNSAHFANSYFTFPSADNDLVTTVDYSASYFSQAGQSVVGQRVLGSSYQSLNCISAGSLISGCGQTITVTPNKTGPQTIWLYTHTDGINARISATQSSTVTSDLPTSSSPAVDEEVSAIAINPASAGLAYTISLTALSKQGTPSAAYIAIMSVALGGPNAGGVSTGTLSSAGFFGTPSGIYGARTSQLDPPTRIPAATTSITLCLSAGNPGGCVNDTLTHYIATETASAAGGVDIHLPLGFVSNAAIILPNRSNNNWVRVIADGAHNTFGQRANPADYPYPRGSSNPALLNLSSNNTPIIQNDSNNASMSARAAHHYAFVGMEITAINTGAVGNNFGLVSFSPGVSGTVAGLSHDLIFQGVYAHRDPTQVNQVNGFNMDADAWGIYDSYISQIVAPNVLNESHGVLVTSSRGPFTFKNNYIQACTEDFLTGGVTPQPNVVTLDGEIIGNQFDKDTAWIPGPYLGGSINNKNELELKEGQYITISGNVFTNGISGFEQWGQAIFIRSFDFGGTLFRTTSNYLISNNVVRNGSWGFSIEGRDQFGLGGDVCGTGIFCDSRIPRHYLPTQYDIKIFNNYMTGLSFASYGIPGNYITSACFAISPLGHGLVIDHNQCEFDSATDNAYFSTHGGVSDHAMYVVDRQTMDPAARALNPSGCDSSSPAAFPTDVSTWTFTNNILSGEVGGTCIDDAQFLPQTMQAFTNNTFFNIVHLDQGAAFGYSIPFYGTGNTHTTSTAIPVVAGRGVDKSTLPNWCTVTTGNRSDVSCTPVTW